MLLTLTGIVAVSNIFSINLYLSKHITSLSDNKKDLGWSPPIDANFTAAGKNETLLTENLAACDILVTSQGGVGSSSFLEQLSKYARANSPSDQDGLKHKAASCWKSHNSSSINGYGRCFTKVLVLIGDPLHTIESTWRRFHAVHLNKLRSGCNKVGDPYEENISLHEIYSEMLDVGKDMTGIDQYVQSWYKASQDRSNWPEIKIVTSQTIYDNAVEFARWLGVNDEDLRHFSGFSYDTSKMHSIHPDVTKSERVRLNEMFENVTRIAELVTEIH